MVDFTKVGQLTRVICPQGPGRITGWTINNTGKVGPRDSVRVTLDNGTVVTFERDGRRGPGDQYPSLFLDDGTFQWPEQSQPLPELEVDTLIWVRGPQSYGKWKPQYFSRWAKRGGTLFCFKAGATSKTADNLISFWEEYSLTDPNEPSVQDICDSQESCSCRPNLERGATIWVRRNGREPWQRASFLTWQQESFQFPVAADNGTGAKGWQEYRLTDPYA